MTTTVASLTTKAGILLQDTALERTTESELILWIGDGQKQIVEFKPEANAKRAAVALTAGVTLQSLPADGIALVEVTRNMGADGATPGDAIRIARQEDLDAFLPSWHSSANTVGRIQNFLFNFLDPKRYFVFPKAPATAWYVELLYGAVPAAPVQGGNITLADEYANALLNYILFRAYAKDAEDTGNLALATGAYEAFIACVNGKTTVEAQRDPNKKGA